MMMVERRARCAKGRFKVHDRYIAELSQPELRVKREHNRVENNDSSSRKREYREVR
jgi:hypothetical protein